MNTKSDAGSNPSSTSVSPRFFEPNIDDLTLMWVAGLLEGEGSFMGGVPCQPRLPRVTLQMTDLDIVERVANIWGIRVQSHRQDEKAKLHGWKPIYIFKLVGSRAVSLMKRLRPLMGKRRQSQIDKALLFYKARTPVLTKSMFEEIKRRLSIGDTHSSIASDIHVSRQTVSDVSRGIVRQAWFK